MHRDVEYIGCSDTEKEYLFGFDGEELFHSDFIRKEGVVTTPDFADSVSFPGFYENSVAQIETCKQNLAIDIRYYKSPVEQLGKIYTVYNYYIFTYFHIIFLLFQDKMSQVQISIIFCVFTDPPDTSIYSKADVVLDVANTLICHVTGFFPPPVNVSWTKNNQIVSESMSLSQYRRKNDGTFNIFSTLKFTPKEGDIYSCTVYHKSIQGQPKTKTWGEELFHID